VSGICSERAADFCKLMASRTNSVGKGPGERLSEMLSVGPDDGRLWQPEELAAVFRHQMAAPIVFDLGAFEQGFAARLKGLTEAQGLLVKSFGDLLHHPQPPLELLRLTKEFAKANREHPASLLPKEVATALYYSSIAVALVRCGKRISRLADRDLTQGWAWILEQNWIDDQTKGLVRQAVALNH